MTHDYVDVSGCGTYKTEKRCRSQHSPFYHNDHNHHARRSIRNVLTHAGPFCQAARGDSHYVSLDRAPEERGGSHEASRRLHPLSRWQPLLDYSHPVLLLSTFLMTTSSPRTLYLLSSVFASRP